MVKYKLKSDLRAKEEISDSKSKIYPNLMASISMSKNIRSSKAWLRYAAVIAILVCPAIFYLLIQNNIQKNNVALLEVKANLGERKTVLLPDGSKVVVNGGGAVVYPEQFTGKKRNIKLQGEAFFKVKRNPDKPFVVSTNEVITTVLGTSFNINESNNSVVVTVSSGKVMVSTAAGGNEVYLVKDQQVNFDLANKQARKSTINSKLITEWSQGVLHFNHITVKEAFEAIGSWYNVSVECASESIFRKTNSR